MTDDRPLVDKIAGTLCLGAGYHAVETVAADGNRGYWILDPNHDRTGGA